MMTKVYFCVILFVSSGTAHAQTPTPVEWGTPFVTPTIVVNALPNVAIAQANQVLPAAMMGVSVFVIAIFLLGRVILAMRLAGRRGRKL